MNLYYAMGGGVGHLVRARAVIHTLGLNPSTTSILSSSPYAIDSRIVGTIPVRVVPKELGQKPGDWRKWIERVTNELQPENLYLDTFPAGILGEFEFVRLPATTAVHHVARLLNPGSQRELFATPGPRFDTCYIVEDLDCDHRTLLRDRSRATIELSLIDPSPVEATAASAIVLGRHSNFWLVVHSGPTNEVAELLAFADGMRDAASITPHLVALTLSPPDVLPPGTSCYDVFPATPLFPHTARIFTAGGFNAMRQTAPWRNRHFAMPFSRRHDDQYRRVARARNVTKGTDVAREFASAPVRCRPADHSQPPSLPIQ